MVSELQISHLGINIADAKKYLAGKVIHTPIRRLPWLEEIVNVPVWVKLEQQQYTGSFKYRGALYALRNHSKSIPVIAASAGNHGLAVAYVCQQLKIKANICLPANASRLKRQRILNTGCGLIEFGSSLDESIMHAQKLALDNNWRFISPYNDIDLISSAGTIAQEFLVDIPDLKYLIVPVGGGGLISGMALGARELNPAIKILGCEPRNYPSMSQSLLNMRETRVPNIPTYADGLAVNLEENSLTLKLVRDHVNDIITLSEEDLGFGTFALLNKESLLVEPAGSAGIAGLIKYFKMHKLDGPVGIPLCGGNIQKNSLNRILQHHFVDPTYIAMLDLRGQKLTNTSIVKPYMSTKKDLNCTKNRSSFEDFKYLYDKINSDLFKLQSDIDSYIQFCKFKNLPYDSGVTQAIKKYLYEIENQICIQIAEFNNVDYLNSNSINIIELKARWALQGLSHARTAIEWRAAAYDQSNATQFFDLSAQDNPSVNYDRYFSPEVKRIEDQVCEILSVPMETHGAFLTSSGMAAYSLIETFLLRFVLTPKSTILMTPYIYFEAKEQLEGLKMFKIKQTCDFCADSILDSLEKDDTINVVFADPLANLVNQPMTDIIHLIKGIKNLKNQRPIKLVIDGTMLSGALLPSILEHQYNLEVLYYESCSKYLQVGLESCLAGVVVFPLRYQAYFERLRRNTGTILYRQQAFAYPFFSKELFLGRMRRIGENAYHLAKLLSEESTISQAIHIFYPLLPSHNDCHIAALLPYCGGCVTFYFKDNGKNNNNFLESFITRTLHNARDAQIPLTKGVSFGYTIPRISAASSIAESEFPFLRLYVGDLGSEFVERLAYILINTFKEILSKSQHSIEPLGESSVGSINELVRQ